MQFYNKPDSNIYDGRTSSSQLYLHEKIKLINLEEIDEAPPVDFGILGYACDVGVKRNLGRSGTVAGPQSIRAMLAGLSNHFDPEKYIADFGDFTTTSNQLEDIHGEVTNGIALLLKNKIKPIVLGGGHDLAYAHYLGIREVFKNEKIGIINFDAHFDLRAVSTQRNSGTPFWQIAETEKNKFYYLCLGIQEESNNRELFEYAKHSRSKYLLNTEFTSENWDAISKKLNDFIAQIDKVYVTIDLDGFCSAYAPGVSAPSPLGFTPDIVLKCLDRICRSQKLVSTDLVELNPHYDTDNATARLASRLVYTILKNWKS